MLRQPPPRQQPYEEGKPCRELPAARRTSCVPITREEAEQAVSAALYPPTGTRSVGGSVHALNFGTTAMDYFTHANEEVIIVLQCEHIQSVENADAIFSVPGIDAI